MDDKQLEALEFYLELIGGLCLLLVLLANL